MCCGPGLFSNPKGTERLWVSFRGRRYFNASGQAELYELRILQDKERIKTAIYVAENQLDNDMTKYLARAIR